MIISAYPSTDRSFSKLQYNFSPITAKESLGFTGGFDVVIFFNFRTDRGRELTQALSQQPFPEYDMEPLDLYYITLTNYDDSFKGVKVVFDKENLQDTLGEVLSKAGKTQVRIAETEKYAHVTFFFNGGEENAFEGEERIGFTPQLVAHSPLPYRKLAMRC